MPYSINTLTEYVLECDECEKEEVFHTGSCESGNYAYTNDLSIRTLRDAFKTANFHKVVNPRHTKGSLAHPKYIVLCDECFSLRKNQGKR
jgi:hypothetical protein